MVVHACSPSTWEVEAEGLGVQSHCQLYTESKARLATWELVSKMNNLQMLVILDMKQDTTQAVL